MLLYFGHAIHFYSTWYDILQYFLSDGIKLFQWLSSCPREKLMITCKCFIQYFLERKQRWAATYLVSRFVCVWNSSNGCYWILFWDVRCWHSCIGTNFKEKYRPVFRLCVDWEWGILLYTYIIHLSFLLTLDHYLLVHFTIYCCCIL